MSTTLLSEDRGKIRILTMNRPEKRNALNTELTQALLQALRVADSEDSVDALVLAGAGPGFCAGADVGEFKGLKDPKAAAAWRKWRRFRLMAAPAETLAMVGPPRPAVARSGTAERTCRTRSLHPLRPRNGGS